MKTNKAVNVGRNTFTKPAFHKKNSGHILLLQWATKISRHMALKSKEIFYSRFNTLN
jgi:hypothetical protein